jgi:hypothetical protein
MPLMVTTPSFVLQHLLTRLSALPVLVLLSVTGSFWVGDSVQGSLALRHSCLFAYLSTLARRPLPHTLPAVRHA